MSPIAGFTRFRQWAFSGAQSGHGTGSTPIGTVPWRGTPDLNPNWTDIEDVDTGSIDPVLSQYRTAHDITATLEGPADFDSLVLPLNAGVRGAVTPTGAGAAKTWTHTALSLTATALDEISASWGDDFGQDDLRFRDGIVEQIELSFDEGLGPWRISTQWRFGYVDPFVTKPTGLTLASNLPLIFGADTALYIDATGAGIGVTQISQALHMARIRIANTIDVKRFADGSNSRFAVAGYGLAGRTIEAEFNFAKTTAVAGYSASELRNVLNQDPVTRYLKLGVISPALIPTTATPYSLDLRLPLQWTKPGWGERGNNSMVTLSGRAQWDAGLAYAIKSVIVNGNAALP